MARLLSNQPWGPRTRSRTMTMIRGALTVHYSLMHRAAKPVAIRASASEQDWAPDRFGEDEDGVAMGVLDPLARQTGKRVRRRRSKMGGYRSDDDLARFGKAVVPASESDRGSHLVAKWDAAGRVFIMDDGCDGCPIGRSVRLPRPGFGEQVWRERSGSERLEAPGSELSERDFSSKNVLEGRREMKALAGWNAFS